MRTFFYVARDSSGDKVTGTLEAKDKDAALTELKKCGRFPISITEDETSDSDAIAGGLKSPLITTSEPNNPPRSNIRSAMYKFVKFLEVTCRFLGIAGLAAGILVCFPFGLLELVDKKPFSIWGEYFAVGILLCGAGPISVQILKSISRKLEPMSSKSNDDS